VEEKILKGRINCALAAKNRVFAKKFMGALVEESRQASEKL